MSEKDQLNIRLILRIAAVVVLTVVVLFVVLFSPQHVATNMPMDTMKRNIATDGAFAFDVSARPLDTNALSNFNYWLDKEGASRCQLNFNQCLSPQCHAANTEDPTFDNELMLETDRLWTDEFMQQIESINQSMMEYNGSFHPSQIDLRMALEYFCCFTAGQYRVIGAAMEQFEFVRFDRILCVGDEELGDGRLSVALFADGASQQYLSSLTDRIEEYLRDDWNISIHSHRRDAQPFHATLLRIEDSEEGDVLDLVEYLNAQHLWEDAAITVDRSCMCMNGKEQYDIEYQCF